MGMHKQTSRMIQETNSQYNESYVRSATQEVEETLNRIYSMAESISKKLRRKSDSLIWSANHYKQTEDQLKFKLIQPFKFSGRNPTIGNSSSSNNFVLPKSDKISVFKVSGSVTLMQMLKNLWSKARDSLLIKSLASFQEDERISSLIKQLQTGTLDEQKVARQQLSEIAHAFDEIARSQVAYAIYSDFGNLMYMKAEQAQANLNREALAGLGISDKWYNVDVNLAENYKDSFISMPI